MDNLVYRVRPDIFMQEAPGRLRIHHQGQNFVLKVSPDVAKSFFQFVELSDGQLSYEVILSHFPLLHQEKVKKFGQFLVNNQLAFNVKLDEIITNTALTEVITYLAQFTDTPSTNFQRFSTARYLLVGGGYSLISGVKTLAQMGIKSLHIINTDVSSTDLIDNFDQLSTHPEAKLTINSSFDGINITKFDYVLQLHDQFDTTLYDSVIRICKQSSINLLQGYQHGNQLFLGKGLHKNFAQFKNLPTTVTSPMSSLITGSVFATMVFDHLTGIRVLPQNHYGHFCLDMQGEIKMAKRIVIKPIGQLKPQDKSFCNVITTIENHQQEPLFPISKVTALSHQVKYLNLNQANVSLFVNGVEQSIQVYGIGFDHQQSMNNLLENMLLDHSVWFESDAKQTQAIAMSNYYHQQLKQLNSLTTLNSEVINGNVGKHADYIRFCINSSFAYIPVIERIKTTNHQWLTVSAGECRVYMPHSFITPSDFAISEDDYQRLMLKLYLQLWLRNQGQQNNDVVLILPQKKSLTAQVSEYDNTSATA